MSCNSCSNVTLPGVVGPAGAPGANGTNGTGINSISWTSNSNSDPQGTPETTDTYTISYSNGTTSTFVVANGDNGNDGTNGTTLLKSITSEQVVTSSSYTSVFSHSVVANSLFSDEDTLRFEGLVLNTESDQSLVGLQVQFASTDLQIGFTTSLFDWPNLEMKNVVAYEIWIDIVRVSSSSVRIESKIRAFTGGANLSNYSASVMFPAGGNFQDFFRSSQTITSLNLVSTPYTFNVNLRTDSVSRPTKLTKGKLYLIKK